MNENSNNEMTDYSRYIHLSRYARYLPEEGRRETWEETVYRYTEFFYDRGMLSDEDHGTLTDAIVAMEVMPSMRCMMSAGTALERDNVAGFNCSYLAIDHLRCFDEIMYILMCGTGVGFSCERQEIAKLPELPEEIEDVTDVFVVRDSKSGWAEGFRTLVRGLYSGKRYRWDLSRVRQEGARLKTFGGRASGPEPLAKLFKWTVKLCKQATSRRLTSLEVHDLCCKIADTIVVGGVRRSALISLSNLSDDRMRGAKAGQWWADEPQRALANNSAVYTEKPSVDIFMKEWSNLYESRSGERGIINRTALQQQAGGNGRRYAGHAFGVNPCGEIILRPSQFCNLSEVIVRPTDNLEDLIRKVRLATILGTLQSTLTDFRYLRPIWKRNTEEECLLGVSLTGIMDHPTLRGDYSPDEGEYWDYYNDCPLEFPVEDWLEELQQVAIDTNKEWAEKLGVNASKAITCVKPSGTVSQLVDSSSGIHPRFAPYYLRRVISDKNDPLADFMIDQGVPHKRVDNKVIFEFPQKAPEGSKCVGDVGAMEQYSIAKTYNENWCEHNSSCTVYYTEDEFLELGAAVYKDFDKVAGLSFFPKSDHVYENAPYEEITKGKYEKLVFIFPYISWDTFEEETDNTTATQELACSGGVCEI